MRQWMLITIMVGAVWAGTISGKDDAMPDLKGKRVLIVIAAADFRDEEYFEPYNRLGQCGATVTVASSVKGNAVSVFGKMVATDRQIAECKAENYDAIGCIGGPGAAEFITNATAHALARAAAEQGKVLAAICIAPVTLANAGVLKGKKATVFPSFKSQLAAQGALVVSQDIVQDGKLLTASGPKVAREFASALVKMLE